MKQILSIFSRVSGLLIALLAWTFTTQAQEQEPQEYNVTFSVAIGHEAFGRIKASYIAPPLYNSTLIPSGATVVEGAKVTFSAQPISGYQVDEWKVNGTVVPRDQIYQSILVREVTEHLDVEVFFKKEEFYIYYEVVGEMADKGTLDVTYLNASFDQEPLPNGQTVAKSTTVTFRTTPQQGYETEWFIDGLQAPPSMISEAGNAIRTPVTKDMLVQVRFREKQEVDSYLVTYKTAISYIKAGYLKVTSNGEYVPSGSRVAAGSKVIFEAQPYDTDTNSASMWMGKGKAVQSEDKQTLTVESIDQDYNVTLYLRRNDAPEETPTYKLTFSAVGEPNSGTVAAAARDQTEIPNGSMLTANTTVNLTAMPAEGFVLSHWTVDGKKIDPSAIGLDPNFYSYVTTGKDTHVEAHFVTGAVPKFRVNLKVTEGQEEMGTITGKIHPDDIAIAPEGSDVERGKEVFIEFAPADNIQISKVMLNGLDITRIIRDNVHTIPYLTEDVNLEVSFNTLVEVAVTYLGDENGTVTAKLQGQDIASGDKVPQRSEVEFTALPNDGYKVAKWYVNGVERIDKESTIKVLCEQDTEVRAVFEGKAKVTLTFTHNEGGTLTAKLGSEVLTSGALIDEGSSVDFFATPDEGYKVNAWKVGIYRRMDSSTMRTEVINQSTEVSVEFIKDTAIDLIGHEAVKAYISQDKLLIEGLTAPTPIRLYALSGALLLQTITHTEVDVTDLPQGFYVLRIGDATYKVVK